MRPRGQGSIKRRGNAWHISYYAGGWRRLSVARELGKHPSDVTEQDARDLLQQRLDKIVVDKHTKGYVPTVAQDKVTVADLAADYLTRTLTDGVKDEARHRANVRGIVELWGTQRATTITQSTLYDDAQRLLAQGLKRSTVRLYLRRLRSIFNKAGEALPRVPTFPSLKEDPLRETEWSWDDVERWCKLLGPAHPWLPDVLHYGYHTGWRINEVFGLEWTQVDHKARIISLYRNKKDVPRLRPFALKHFDISAVMQRRLEARRLGCPWVFHLDGRRIQDSTFNVTVHRARKRYGLPDLIFHDFRRGVAHRAELLGLHPFHIQQLLGHKSLHSTRRYTRQDVVSLVAACERTPDVQEGRR